MLIFCSSVNRLFRMRPPALGGPDREPINRLRFRGGRQNHFLVDRVTTEGRTLDLFRGKQILKQFYQQSGPPANHS